MLIRKLNPEDMPQIVDLLATREELDRRRAEDRAAILEWIAFHNPFMDEGQPTYFVVEDEGRVVAIHGRMPSVFTLKGEYKRGYYVHDLYVHKDYREKGKGFWLTIELAKAIEKETDAFFCLFGMTPLNLQMQRRRHYHEMVFDAYVKVIRPKETLSRFLKNRTIVTLLNPLAWLGVRLADLLLLPRKAGGVEVVPVDRFDVRFDALFKRISPSLGVCTVKTADYLNWKYGEGPSRRDVVLAAFVGGDLKGFVVVGLAPRKTIPVGVIKDIVFDPGERNVAKGLFLAAIQQMRDRHVYSIRCVVSDPRFARILRRFLFFRMADHEVVFLGNLAKSPVDAEILRDIRNWHITLGESDIFMFSGGIPPVRTSAGSSSAIFQSQSPD